MDMEQNIMRYSFK